MAVSFNIMQKMIKTNLNELKTRLAIHLLIGFFGMLSYHLLDHIYYLNFWLPLLIVRLFAMAYCFIFYFVIEKIPEKLVSVIIASAYVVCGISISYITLIVGEGFNSIYFAGNMVIILVAAILSSKPFIEFLVPGSLIIIFHNILLFSGPAATWRTIFTNFGFLFYAVWLGFLLNIIVNKIRKEVMTLRTILPICANCKKIRDDKGYWNQIERYITDHSETEFTHGLCPECAKSLYGFEEGKL
ncbi:MAG: hypothetical protein ABIG64_05670 [Candidatus Omnitrophota bacterium]